jgi:ADP-heptose:LPS heptosyltransferase
MKDKAVGKPVTRPILIFRRGSIGDAIVSIPALNEIARRHPDAERWILTNLPVMETAAPVAAVLDNSTLVSGFISLPPGGGGCAPLIGALRRIRGLRPDRLIYLSEPTRGWARIQERGFFRMAGIRTTVGNPDSPDFGTYRKSTATLWESESERLLRAIGANPAGADWSFRFLPEERGEARRQLEEWPGRGRYILFSLGAKLPDKDWGEANWKRVLNRISQAHPGLGAVAIGAADESEPTRRVLSVWAGPTLDLCGRTPPRISALVGEGALFYLGHDSGPMHLAALVGTPCVAVFSARAKPGVWFPRGQRNRIFYPWHLADSVPARAGFRTAGGSISTIEPAAVSQACLDLLATSAAA